MCNVTIFELDELKNILTVIELPELQNNGKFRGWIAGSGGNQIFFFQLTVDRKKYVENQNNVKVFNGKLLYLQ